MLLNKKALFTDLTLVPPVGAAKAVQLFKENKTYCAQNHATHLNDIPFTLAVYGSNPQTISHQGSPDENESENRTPLS